MKARVRRRARAIQRWRRVPPLGALLLVVAIVVPQLAGESSPSVLRVAGEADGAESADEGAGDDDGNHDASPSSTSTSTTTTSSTTTTTPRGLGDVTSGPIVDLSSDLPPRFVSRDPGKPLVVDQKGDAWDKDWCEAPHCPDETRLEERVSQPALDILSLDLRCTASNVVFTTEVLDADAAPQGSPTELTHVALVAWDDGPTNSATGNSSDAWLEVTATRNLSSGALVATGRVWMYSDSGLSYERNVSDVRGRLEGDVVVVEVPFEAWAAAGDAMFPGRTRPSSEMRITRPVASSFEDSVRVDDAVGEAAQPPPSYALCR